MSNLNLELNIYNYTTQELLNLLNINHHYNKKILKEKIKNKEKEILQLQLSSSEKNDIIVFLRMMEVFLIKDLEIKKIEMEIEKLKNK
tara:strand:- start:2650 stop:2913 length:264 start_codon:yes stop_codon:yes gene_type:complete